MDVIWTAQRPKVCGLYWRRNSDQGVPSLTIVFEGPNGVKVRIVEQPINWGASGCENDPIERPVEAFSCGAWALKRFGHESAHHTCPCCYHRNADLNDG